MKKIVFADTDREYMSLLEEHLAEEWAEKADIEMITEPDDLKKLFLESGDIFLLVIHKSLYLQEEKTGAKMPHHILLLLEDTKENRGILKSGPYSAQGSYESIANRMFCGQPDALVQEIYKYSDMQELFARIRILFSEADPSDAARRTKLILTHACSGGVGKTVGTLGMCIAFAKMHRRVLYVNTESVQDFGLYLTDAQWMNPEEAFGISINDARMALRPPVSQDRQGYDYIKVLPKITQVYQIQSRSYVFLIRKLLEENQYDVIVAELPLHADADLLSLYDAADRIVMFRRQDVHSMKKLWIFMQSLMVPLEKYIFLCNWYDDRKQDAQKSRMFQTECMQTFYIRACEALTPEKMSMEKSIAAISYAIF